MLRTSPVETAAKARIFDVPPSRKPVLTRTPISRTPPLGTVVQRSVRSITVACAGAPEPADAPNAAAATSVASTMTPTPRTATSLDSPPWRG